MCYFLTIGVRASAADMLLHEVPRGLALMPISNASIGRQLGPSYQTFVLMSGQCSCDLYRDRAMRTSPEDLRQKYRKKGWTAAKIARSIASAATHAQKTSHFVGLRADVRDMLASIAQRAGSLTIVVHWFHGDVATEEIPFSARLQMSPEQLRQPESPTPAEQLLHVHVDAC